MLNAGQSPDEWVQAAQSNRISGAIPNASAMMCETRKMAHTTALSSEIELS